MTMGKHDKNESGNSWDMMSHCQFWRKVWSLNMKWMLRKFCLKHYCGHCCSVTGSRFLHVCTVTGRSNPVAS